MKEKITSNPQPKLKETDLKEIFFEQMKQELGSEEGRLSSLSDQHRIWDFLIFG
jgi:hypothetical protein